MQDAVTAQLRRLSAPSAVFRRQAVVGVFHILPRLPAHGTAREDAAAACLSSPHPEVVEEASAQLLAQLTGL